MEFRYVATKEVPRSLSFYKNKMKEGDKFDYFMIEIDKDSFSIETILEKELKYIERDYILDENTGSEIKRLWLK